MAQPGQQHRSGRGRQGGEMCLRRGRRAAASPGDGVPPGPGHLRALGAAVDLRGRARIAGSVSCHEAQ